MDRTRLLIKLKRYHYGQKNAVSSKELEATADRERSELLQLSQKLRLPWEVTSD